MASTYRRKLLSWYEINKRNLPWRETRNAYYIWLSEIILQQTRIEQGEKYFLKFKQTFPKIEDLAKATENTILNMWQGLGYYSRARNLHKTAQIINAKFDGEFPSDYKTILSLPGVGPYTAAAISSFAFKLPHAVVDGNVYRFLSRLNGIRTPIDSSAGKKEFQQLADELLDVEHNDTYNQAIMEFGATNCTQHNPKCKTCPFNLDCVAFKEDVVHILPIKEKSVRKTVIHTNYGFRMNAKNEVLVQKRDDRGIWKNMYQFPELDVQILKNSKREPCFKKKHLLTHQTHHINIFELDEQLQPGINHQWMPLAEIKNNPFPQPFVEFFKQMDIAV